MERHGKHIYADLFTIRICSSRKDVSYPAEMEKCIINISSLRDCVEGVNMCCYKCFVPNGTVRN
jgi:hypothetical protein